MFKNSYWRFEKALSPEFCNLVIKETDWESGITAGVGAGMDPTKPSSVQDSMRKTDIVWVPLETPIACVAQTYINYANGLAAWNFSVAFIEQMQLGRYTQGGHYDWHYDIFHPDQNNLQRKLSVSILLNDPLEYEGGELQLEGVDECNLLKNQGDIVVFPSFAKHRVAPITNGTRYSAVTWALGPAFK